MLQIILGAVIWVIFAIPVFEGVFNIGNAVGLAFGAALFLWGLFRKRLIPVLVRLREKKPLKILTDTVCIAFCAVMLYCCAGAGMVLYGMNNAPPEGTEVVIVLGCKVREDGQPATTLRARLDAALDFLENNPDSICVVTGGQGSDEVISEAQCMKNYLLSQGLDESRILFEDRSTSTKENFLYSKEILTEKYGDTLPPVAVATSNYHCFRAGIAAKKLGYKTYSIPAMSPREMLPTYTVREIFGIIGEAFFR